MNFFKVFRIHTLENMLDFNILTFPASATLCKKLTNIWTLPSHNIRKGFT